MSENFNSFEKIIARVLSRVPWLKKYAKYMYSYFFYLLKKKSYKYKSTLKLNIIEDSENETFFGYYDKCPDNGNGLVLVCSSVVSTRSLPKDVESIGINVYSLSAKKYILDKPIEVLAFNWQQGSRAHWLDEDIFVYNDYDVVHDRYITKCYSVSEGDIVNTYSNAVQDSFRNKFMLSICYKSLAVLRADYGYFRHESFSLPKNQEVGIWKCNYLTSETELLFSVTSVCEFEFSGNASDFAHKLNHVMISPTGQSFIFMHRYYDSRGRRFDRLLLAGANGELLRVLADNQMVSHCYWYDDKTILGYLRSPEGIDGYWLIDVNTGSYSSFSQTVFCHKGDGHPSLCGDYIVTDTYPNKSRMQSLYLSKKNSPIEMKIGEFFHGFDFSGETRCDLHPRFSKDGNIIFFDSVFSGKRQLCYVDIGTIKEKFFNND
ncbi:glycosyl transferase [Vibrio maritimus]|uniref:glycosyl transferase n=1 Tax=Vibrio maritimus TaxID=990268 RepID=UPI004069600A